MKKSNKRNKAKKSKVITEINFSELQDELRQSNKYINRKPKKNRANKR